MSKPSFFSGIDKTHREPWATMLGFNEQTLEWDRIKAVLDRLEQVLDQDRTVLTRVHQSESRTTGDDKRPVLYFRKEHVKLTLELEWDEWHAVPERGEDEDEG